jgi:tetratricopeptide (TPR) repeat protein
MPSQLRAACTAVLIFMAAFAVYLFTMVPSVTGDDSGELAAVGATLGTAHSPGYPLYCLAAKAAVTAVPWGNAAYRVNLVSALFIALAAALIFIALSAAGGSAWGAAALALAFAFSHNVWAMANVTEVYGLAAVAAVGLALIMLQEPTMPALCAAAYLFGVGMTAHYTVGLLLPGIFLWVSRPLLSAAPDRRARIAGALVVSAACGFSLVAYLYIRAKAGALVSWEDPRTAERFWQVVARLRYGSMALAQGGAPPLDPGMVVKKVGFFFAELARNFTWAGVALFAVGCVAWARDRVRGWPLLVMLICSGPGFLLLANVGLDRDAGALLERFFFLTFIFAVLAMGRGAQALPKPVQAAILLLPAFLLYGNFRSLDHRREFLFHDYAKNILRSLPAGSLLYADRADEMEFCVGYLLAAEGRRPDIAFTDCNAGISHSIYGDDYYRMWGKPRLERRYAVESAAIARTERPVYYATFDPGMIAVPRLQEGLVFRVPGKGQERPRFPYDAVYALRIPDAAGLDERGMGLLLSHFQLLGDYGLAAAGAGPAERNFRGVAAFDDTGRWTSHAAFLYHQKGMLPLAEVYYRRAIAAGRESVELYTNLGAICETLGRRAEARTMYETALRLDPGNVQTHFNLAVLDWKEADWQGAVTEFSRVLDGEPGNAQARYFRDAALRRVRP